MAEDIIRKKNAAVKNTSKVKERASSLDIAKVVVIYAIVSIFLLTLLFFPLWLSVQTNKLKANITDVNLKMTGVERNIALLQDRLNTISHMILVTANDVFTFKENGIPYYIVGK